MLSSTTTALSTSMPTASIRPIIDRMLSERPPKYSSASAASSENGIASATTSTVWSRRRNSHSTRIASRAPIRPASSRPRSEFEISSPWSVKVSTWMPASSGSAAMRRSAWRARAATCTELAPDSLMTFSPTARASSRWRP